MTLNDKGHFTDNHINIYPDVLTLNTTNVSNTSTNYLDMNISVVNDKFQYKLYDKRNDFDFKVISLPNLKSNVPINASYSVIYSQITRYFNATNNVSEFLLSIDNLKSKMLMQNFANKGIVKQINKFMSHKAYEFISKFWSEPVRTR